MGLWNLVIMLQSPVLTNLRHTTLMLGRFACAVHVGPAFFSFSLMHNLFQCRGPDRSNWLNNVIPQTDLSESSNGVVLRGLGWSGAPGVAAVIRKRCYLPGLVMPGQKTLRGTDKKKGTVHFS